MTFLSWPVTVCAEFAPAAAWLELGAIKQLLVRFGKALPLILPAPVLLPSPQGEPEEEFRTWISCLTAGLFPSLNPTVCSAWRRGD